MRSKAVQLSAHRRELLRARASGMRHSPTASELALWRYLRGRQLGVQFRRQVVLAGCIVDFYASSVRLVVEVDGAYHRERARADARRDAVLRSAGYRVLRLSEELVTRELEVALTRVRCAVNLR